MSATDETVAAHVNDRCSEDFTDPLPQPKLETPPSKSNDHQNRTPKRNVSSRKDEIMRDWEGFVRSVEKSYNSSLVSLLNSSVVVSLNEIELKIGCNNTQLYTFEKREQLQKAAKIYFNSRIQLHFVENEGGVDVSLRTKFEEKQKKNIEHAKTTARNCAEIKNALNTFINSEITSVDLIKE